MLKDMYHLFEPTILGLYPNVIITSDSNSICFVNIDNGTISVLSISADCYHRIGNLLVINSKDESMLSQINDLVSKGLCYKLLCMPAKILDTNLHDLPTQSILESNALNDLFSITIVLDNINELPLLHYPSIAGALAYRFSECSLCSNELHNILKQIKSFRKIRVLSKNVFQHEILQLDILKDVKLETIVDYQYYVSHLTDIKSIGRQLSIIVDITDIYSFNDDNCASNCNANVSVTYCCPIHKEKDLDLVSQFKTHIIPYLADNLSLREAHNLLDYSIEDLMQRGITKGKFFVNSLVNTNYYGNIIIDNEGNINSYPLIEFKNNKGDSISRILTDIKRNRYWNLKRDDYFVKCSDCALAKICPPLSAVEINTGEVFCLNQ